jgi:hypothetical protein
MINNMTNTLVLNSGSTQSVLIKNGKAKTNGVQWNANYDGDIANVDLKLNDNGRENHYKVEMTNDELENIANMLVEPRPVNKPIHNRLLEDFDENNMFNNMESPMIIELDNINPYYTQPKTHTTYNTHKTHKTHKPRSNFLTHISSPNSFDDLKIMPFNGHLNKHTSYKRKRPKTYRIIKVKKHKKYKRPKTYRIIKVKKNGRSSRRSSRI